MSDAFTKRIYVRARYLDTAKARRMTKDPSGLRGGTTNVYRYAFNGAITFTDPSGLKCPKCCGLQCYAFRYLFMVRGGMDPEDACQVAARFCAVQSQVRCGDEPTPPRPWPIVPCLIGTPPGIAVPVPQPDPSKGFTRGECLLACEALFGRKRSVARSFCKQFCSAMGDKSCDYLWDECSTVLQRGNEDLAKKCYLLYNSLCSGQ